VRESYAVESVRIGSFRPLFPESLPESFRLELLLRTDPHVARGGARLLHAPTGRRKPSPRAL